MKKSKLRFWLIFDLLWLALIFGHSCMPATVSRAESGGLLAVVQTVLPWMSHTLLRKLGHITEYAILGVGLTGLFSNKKGYALHRPVAAGLFAALCDETIQLFVAGRSGEVRDIWIDLGGLLLGALLLRLVYRIRK